MVSCDLHDACLSDSPVTLTLLHACCYMAQGLPIEMSALHVDHSLDCCISNKLVDHRLTHAHVHRPLSATSLRDSLLHP